MLPKRIQKYIVWRNEILDTGSRTSDRNDMIRLLAREYTLFVYGVSAPREGQNEGTFVLICLGTWLPS